ncbi:multiprotein bridging factor aMBF1 [Candidatus Woesearchaeota archaeon]|nr:multiprotein bridging factor aMBF1 [Candidatus Woesearchaeota archaeon]
MRCDMCGVEGKLYKVRIEGTEMNVCSECSRFGKVIGDIREVKVEKKVKRIVEDEPEVIEMVVGDFAEKIRRKRNELGLNQEEFAKKINQKKSFVHQMENREMMPSIDLARKLERMLNIELVEEIREEKAKKANSKGDAEAVTIGDLIKIKKVE